MKLAVISDLHCKNPQNEKNGKSTFLYSDDLGLVESRHPVKALIKLINDSKITANYAICPGDITDGADPAGLMSGWNWLEKIRSKLGAEYLISTVGNHDASSRDLEIDSPFEILRVLDDKYPLPTKEVNDEYWLHGFGIFTHEKTLFLVFNSCFSHVSASKAQTSKVTNNQIETIRKRLIEINAKDFQYKVFLCHHHPISQGNLDNADIDVISNGDKLIDLLNEFNFQVCIHGHKHDPKIRVLDKLPIFGSGSFSSLMNVTDLKSDNTFHLIHLEEKENKGYIQTWVYMPLKGWIQRDDTPFPCNVGFGFDGRVQDLSKAINKILEDKSMEYIVFERLTALIGDLKYLNLKDQIDLTSDLKDNHNLVFIPAYPNTPQILIKQVI